LNIPLNKIKNSVLLLVALCSALLLRGQPQVPDRPSPPRLVNDFAGLFNAGEVADLERTLVAYDDSSSTQIAVVTLKSLGDYPIEDWALEIGRKWGVGRKQKNNGVVIIVSTEPRKINISPGYGLEGALPDITCKRIITNYIAPKFKEGKFYEGITEGVRGIRAAVKGEFVNDQSSEGGDFPAWVFILIIIIVIALFILFIIYKQKHYAEYGRGKRRYRDHDNGGTIWWGTGGGFGGGGWSGGDSDSGGFGGFGGGDFGGGGASGDW
jgi:uncharacterized protein